MNHLKNYKNFIKEKIELTDKDTPEIASDKNELNIAEVNVKEYNTKKTVLENIYKTYKDEKDLFSKLKSNKFISVGSNIKDVIFINPLLGFYAQICQKRREVDNLQEEVNDYTKQISEKTSSISNNPNQKDAIQSEIEGLKTKIDESKESIKNILQEVSNLEKEAYTKLSNLKKDILNSTKRITGVK